MLVKKTLFFLFLLFSGMQLQARSLPEFADLVEENGKAVVNISTRQKVASAHSWNKLREELGDGLQIPEGSPFSELFKHFLG